MNQCVCKSNSFSLPQGINKSSHRINGTISREIDIQTGL